MPKINLKQAFTSAKNDAVASAQGKLESFAGAAGKGMFGVSIGKNGVSINANFNELLAKKTIGNNIKSPLSALFNNPKIQNQMQFPSTLDNEHYMIFSVVQTDRKDRSVAPTTTVTRNIILPIPSNLGVQYGADYENAELGAFGAAITGGLDTDGAGKDIATLLKQKFKGLKSEVGGGAGDSAREAAGIGAAVAATAIGASAGGAVGALTAGITGGATAQAIGKKEGLALNPHMAVLFKGVGFREHSFTYKFVARNSEESQTIQSIINTFKYHMHPDYFAGNISFSYPDEFQIAFADAIAANLYTIGKCVLKGMDVNYNSEGKPLFFEDVGNGGAPVSVELTLNFQELQIVTKSDMVASHTQAGT